MNENEFELDGKVYVAVHGGGCATCCFNNHKSIEKCALMTCVSDDASYREKDAPHCHISTQCDIHAEEEVRKQALEDEIERATEELICSVGNMFPWISAISIEAQAYKEAKRIVTSGEHYE